MVRPAYVSTLSRTPHSVDTSDDACSDDFGRVRAAYACTPRVLRGSSLYIKDPKAALILVHFLLFSLVFCIVFRAEATPKSRYHTLAPRQVPRSRRSREARFPSRSSAREKFDFRGDLPDLLRNTTPISRSAVRSSSDQICSFLYEICVMCVCLICYVTYVLIKACYTANKVIQVYTEHGTTNLVTYFMSPNNRNGVVIEELNEEDEVAIEPKQRKQKLVHDPQHESCSSSLPLMVYGGESESLSPEMRRTRNWKPREGTRSCSKRLYMETETGDNQDKEAPSSEIRDNQDKEAPSSEIRDNQDKEAPSSVTRDNQDKEVQQEHELDAATVHVPISLSEMLNVDFDPFEGLHDNENNNRIDPTTIHLGSEYQDFDQDNGGLFDGQPDEFNSEKGEDDYSDDDSDSDSDALVDIDNEVDDIDVDMSDFRINIDEGVEYSGFGFNNDVEDEQETDEEEDLEVIDYDVWESLGEDSDIEKNRRVLLKRLGKEKVCSHGVVPGTNVSGPHVEGGTSGASGSHVLGGADKVNKGKGKAVNSKATTCTWNLYASRSSKDGNWYVKTYSLKHTCLQSRKIRACTATFLAKHITIQVQSNPTVPIRSLQEDFQQTYSVGISKHKMFRAKARATKNGVGYYSKQYDLLRDYTLELQSTNPNTTVKIDVVSEPNPNLATRQLKRIYICLGPLKLGFKAGMRDLLGLDGAFMKGHCHGQILTAVSLDSNNGIYPLAYAIVESENTASWKWFLECLGDDLEMGSNSNFTFISDRQKGVIPAIAQLFPNTEHRYSLIDPS
uniref:MULE transposase domain-containing protein n=1 Tax=Lactuca sativa TaxID=4236 RepID=A0A9R1XBL8_LACSA|nr:hypothetical protein LSAT_V11C500232610 [Lactuca sativa]